ncbi:MAG: hypothetical protein JO300_14090 [Silvibacterium sp.]|nr:hypothetical protein [Silvibacterium sp.]
MWNFKAKSLHMMLALSFVTVPAIPLPSKSSTYHFTLKLYDGRTGRQIRWMPVPYLFLGNQHDLEAARRKLNIVGELHTDVNDIDPAQLRVWIDYLQRDCRFQSEQDQNQARTFTYDGKTLAMLPS